MLSASYHFDAFLDLQQRYNLQSWLDRLSLFNSERLQHDTLLPHATQCHLNANHVTHTLSPLELMLATNEAVELVPDSEIDMFRPPSSVFSLEHYQREAQADSHHVYATCTPAHRGSLVSLVENSRPMQVVPTSQPLFVPTSLSFPSVAVTQHPPIAPSVSPSHLGVDAANLRADGAYEGHNNIDEPEDTVTIRSVPEGSISEENFSILDVKLQGECSAPLSRKSTPPPAGETESSSPKSKKRYVRVKRKQRQCENCLALSTPTWRRGPNRIQLCNACGIYFKQKGVLRPCELIIKAENPPEEFLRKVQELAAPLDVMPNAACVKTSSRKPACPRARSSSSSSDNEDDDDQVLNL